MALLPGTRLGPYEVQALVGAGAMGEVYRAFDPRLGRQVAIKVLPPAYAGDPDRLHRFAQEARAAAALNHPNILAVYDIGQHESSPYIVSELLEGETLRTRLTAAAASPRALPARTALDHARQLVRGLAAAHDKGIVHRDLKPENVFVTGDGQVKILDFGLAKLARPELSGSALTQLGDGTSPGAVLGTMGYLSPEQLRGLPADHRSDIFSFGAILYEMLSGRRPFAGESTADTIRAILDDEPPSLPATDPLLSPGLERVLARCLEKNAADRFQSTRDLGFALDSLTLPAGAQAPAAVARRRAPAWLAWALSAAAALVLAAIALAVGRAGETAGGGDVFRFHLAAPPNATLAQTPSHPFTALSPDGRHLAFTATDDGGRSRIWVRSMDSLEARPLPGSEEGRLPFWAPDSNAVAFFASGALKKVTLAGGTAQTLGSVFRSVPNGGTWGRDDAIVYSGLSGPMHRIPAGGGEPAPVTAFDAARGDIGHYFPHFLPDGRRVLFYLRNVDPAKSGIYVQSLDANDARLVAPAQSNVEYAPPGYLLYARDGVLLAQPFDADRAVTTGTPRPVVERIDQFQELGVASFSISPAGVLVYRQSPELGRSRLQWVDRGGKPLTQVGDVRSYRNPRLSPDGKRVAVEISDRTGNRDIWLVDLARGVPVRFTFDPGRDASPVWSADGRTIVWQGAKAVLMKPSDGGGREVVVKELPWIPDDWLPDNRGFLLHPNGPRQIFQIDLAAGANRERLVLDGRDLTTHARVSPDGRWLAFANGDSGRLEIYVQNFPSPEGRWQVSTLGGLSPKWRRDGRELYYLAPDGVLMAVPLTLGALVEIGSPVPLFQTGIEATTGLTWHQYDVTPDGQRFLLNRPMVETSPLTVLLNWPSLLPR